MNKPDVYDERIRELYINNNMAINKISKELGVSVGKVYNRIKAMNISTRKIGEYPPTEKQIKHIKALGQSQKGKKTSKETKEKISKAKFKGGIEHKKKRADGYVAVYFPEHPKANKDGYIMEHDLVMECYIGRHLKDDEVVHHKNHKRDDNKLSNLQLMTVNEHSALHMKERQNKRRNDLSTT